MLLKIDDMGLTVGDADTSQQVCWATARLMPRLRAEYIAAREVERRCKAALFLDHTEADLCAAMGTADLTHLIPVAVERLRGLRNPHGFATP